MRLVFVLAVTAVLGCDPLLVVKGRVRMPDGSPGRYVVVSVDCPADTSNFFEHGLLSSKTTQTTDSEGAFKFATLAWCISRRCTVTAKHADFADATMDVGSACERTAFPCRSENSCSDADLTLTLLPRQSSAQTGDGPM
jgi:hypothetical protein